MANLKQVNTIYFVGGIACKKHQTVFLIANGRWSGTAWRSCNISRMEFWIICKYLLHPFVPLQCRHNERNGFLNHRCLDCLLNRLFRHSSWIVLILKQLQNSVHECLIVGNSSSFRLMAWQWTDAKPFPEQYHFTYTNLSPGLTKCYHDKKHLVQPEQPKL